MKIYFVVAKIFIIAALLIISNHNLALKDAVSRQIFFQEYAAWLSYFFKQGIEVTSYVVQSEWLPDTDDLANFSESPSGP